jgi:hypothetical protein
MSRTVCQRIQRAAEKLTMTQLAPRDSLRGRCETCGREIRDDDGGDVAGLCGRCGARFVQFLEMLG